MWHLNLCNQISVCSRVLSVNFLLLLLPPTLPPTYFSVQHLPPTCPPPTLILFPLLILICILAIELNRLQLCSEHTSVWKCVCRGGSLPPFSLYVSVIFSYINQIILLLIHESHANTSSSTLFRPVNFKTVHHIYPLLSLSWLNFKYSAPSPSL